MTEAERYAALHALYLKWFAQTGSDVHSDLAAYYEARMTEVV